MDLVETFCLVIVRLESPFGEAMHYPSVVQ
jgi:hypothetical protein